jgi:hypothetical protein
MPEGLRSVDRSLDRVASRVTPLLRNRAEEAGWPKDVARRLSVVRSDAGLGVDFEGDPNIAGDLEFGSPSAGPRSALSAFQTPKMKQEIDKISRNSMQDILDSIGRVFR